MLSFVSGRLWPNSALHEGLLWIAFCLSRRAERVSTDAIDWSVARQAGGQVNCNYACLAVWTLNLYPDVTQGSSLTLFMARVQNASWFDHHQFRFTLRRRPVHYPARHHI